MFNDPQVEWDNRVSPIPSLTVGEIVELAKAGVKVELDKVHVHRQDPMPVPPPYNAADALYERYLKSQKHDREDFGFRMPFTATVIFHKDTAYVTVGTDKTPPVLIEDHQGLYPSDTLLAKIVLMLNTEKSA